MQSSAPNFCLTRFPYRPPRGWIYTRETSRPVIPVRQACGHNPKAGTTRTTRGDNESVADALLVVFAGQISNFHTMIYIG